LDCTWQNFIQIITKLYDCDSISSYRLTYRDEEGDDIAVTTDDELFEAFRLAQDAKPPLLRILIAPANFSVSVNTQNLLNSVVFSNTTPVNSPGLKKEGISGNNTNTVNLEGMKNNAGLVNSPPSFGNNQSVKLSTPVQKVEAEKLPEKLPERGGKIPEKENPLPQVSKPKIPDFPKQEKSVCTNVKSVCTNVKNEKEVEPPLPVVYVAGKAYVPKPSTPVRPYTGPTKIPANSSNTSNQPPNLSLVNRTGNLAESISSLVVESSDSILISSSFHSNSIAHTAQLLCDKMVDSNMEVSQAISHQASHFSTKSEALDMQDDMRRNLSDACYETGMNSVKLSDKIAAMTFLNSTQTAEEIQPISGQTRHIQDVATQGLEDHLSQEMDQVVKNIMVATNNSSRPQ